MVVPRSGKIFFKRTAAVCVRIDHELPKDVPVKVRRAVYLKVDRDPHDPAGRAQLRYVVDASAVDEAVTAELATKSSRRTFRTSRTPCSMPPRLMRGHSPGAGVPRRRLAGALSGSASAAILVPPLEAPAPADRREPFARATARSIYTRRGVHSSERPPTAADRALRGSSSRHRGRFRPAQCGLGCRLRGRRDRRTPISATLTTRPRHSGRRRVSSWD